MYKLIVKSKYFSLERLFDNMANAFNYVKELKANGHEVESYNIINQV